jgi:hypothetical protein
MAFCDRRRVEMHRPGNDRLVALARHRSAVPTVIEAEAVPWTLQLTVHDQTHAQRSTAMRAVSGQYDGATLPVAKGHPDPAEPLQAHRAPAEPGRFEDRVPLVGDHGARKTDRLV